MSIPSAPPGRPNSRKPPSEAIERKALTVIESAQALGVHRNSVYRLIEAGLLRYARLAGGEIRVPVAAIDEYLAGGKTA